MVKAPPRSQLASLLLTSLAVALVACGGGGDSTKPKPDGGDTDNPDACTGSCSNPDGSTGRCGDGVKQGAELCDDGNVTSGDGCRADCAEVEIGWQCPVAGRPCNQDPACGNGKVEAGETCDDRNLVSDDGCSATCTLEPGWTCVATGGRCRAAACGDGIIAGDEECEDGNTANDDGCSNVCRLENGYKCPTLGQPCVRTVCGDRIIEGTEQCDDGNNDMGDGCSPLCVREPRCTNGTCQAVCGDGVMLPNDTTEECDDGNTRANDGCSPTCKLENGFVCELIQDAPPDTVKIPVVYRDFRGKDQPAQAPLPAGHLDFENGNASETGIVKADLGADGKPQYNKEPDAGTGSATTHGKTAFDQWYRDTTNVNVTVVDTLDLGRKGGGSYEYDNGSFFPLDTKGWVAQGKEPLRPDNNGVQHNFSFTSEARYWFEYKGTEVLNFRGDDDVWVFINRKLALDLGGVHGAQNGQITLVNDATKLGLTVGGIYEVVVLQAERHTSASSYRLTLNNFVTRRTECRSTCGDGVVDQGEQCDNGEGANDGAYGHCSRTCVLGPRCGDGVKQPEFGEECDDGNTNPRDGCSPLCKIDIG